jgi:hypothetical protein
LQLLKHRRFLGILFCVFFHKFIHSTGGIYKLLFSGKERVTLRTNLYPDIGLGGTGVYGIAAGADNHALLILGMNLVLHFYFLP